LLEENAGPIQGRSGTPAAADRRGRGVAYP